MDLRSSGQPTQSALEYSLRAIEELQRRRRPWRVVAQRLRRILFDCGLVGNHGVMHILADLVHCVREVRSRKIKVLKSTNIAAVKGGIRESENHDL